MYIYMISIYNTYIWPVFMRNHFPYHDVLLHVSCFWHLLHWNFEPELHTNFLVDWLAPEMHASFTCKRVVHTSRKQMCLVARAGGYWHVQVLHVQLCVYVGLYLFVCVFACLFVCLVVWCLVDCSRGITHAIARYTCSCVFMLFFVCLLFVVCVLTCT